MTTNAQLLDSINAMATAQAETNALLATLVAAITTQQPAKPATKKAAAKKTTKSSALVTLPTPTQVGQTGHGIPSGSKATSNHDYVVKQAKSGKLYWTFPS